MHSSIQVVPLIGSDGKDITTVTVKMPLFAFIALFSLARAATVVQTADTTSTELPEPAARVQLVHAITTLTAFSLNRLIDVLGGAACVHEMEQLLAAMHQEIATQLLGATDPVRGTMLAQCAAVLDTWSEQAFALLDAAVPQHNGALPDQPTEPALFDVPVARRHYPH